MILRNLLKVLPEHNDGRCAIFVEEGYLSGLLDGETRSKLPYVYRHDTGRVYYAVRHDTLYPNGIPYEKYFSNLQVDVVDSGIQVMFGDTVSVIEIYVR